MSEQPTFRERSNHDVTRFSAGEQVQAECFCWATETHAAGMERVTAPLRGAGVGQVVVYVRAAGVTG